jgi:hypothetical protein
MKKISTNTEAKDLSDITDDWKVVARRYLGTIGRSSEIHAVWRFCGDLADAGEGLAFQRLAFPEERHKQPLISVVTGRDDVGTLTLYARSFPKAYMDRRFPSTF